MTGGESRTSRQGLSEGGEMPLSARNQIRGTVKHIVLGEVMAEVIVDIGVTEIVAAITRRSVETLGIKVGDEVSAVVKATEVMLMT
jgi:molybdopterin-binding protein